MQINFTIFATGATILANKLRYKAYETSAPTVPVTIVTEDPPHTFPHAVTLNVDNPVPHIVNIYSTPDASDGTLLSSFMYDPTWTNIDIRVPLEINVGGGGPNDPPANSTEIPLPDALGWEYWPERRANGGTMSANEYTLVPAGGIKLVAATDRFEAGEILFIHFKPKVTITQPTFNYLNLYTGQVIIPANTTIDVSYARKLSSVAAVGTAIVITMKPLAEMPNNSRFAFNTFLGNQKQTTFICSSGDGFKIYNQNTSVLYLGSNEFLTFVKYEDGFYVENVSPAIYQVGLFHNADKKLYPNMAYCDGSLLGTVVDYPRVASHLDSLAPGVVFPSLAARTAAGFKGSAAWVKDNSAGLIYVPDCRGLTTRALNETRNDFGLQWTRPAGDLTGSVENGANLLHNHITDSRFNKLGTRASDLDSTGTPNGIDNNNATIEYRVGAMNNDLWDAAVLKSEGKVENVVRNDGRYRLVSL